MRHRFGIRKKIMLTMAFMTIIPVLVMGIVSTAQSRNIIKEQTNTLARKNLIITAQEINEKVDLLYATIQELPTNTVVLSGLRRLPDTSEAHLSYQEQLETELYRLNGNENIKTIIWSRSTVLTYLTRMEAKGLVDIRKEDFPHRYRAAVSREDCAAAERRGLLERAYQGSAGRLVAAFLKDEKLTPQERDELRKLLDEMEV